MVHGQSFPGIEGQGQRSRSTRSMGPRSSIEDSFLVSYLVHAAGVKIVVLRCRAYNDDRNMTDD